MEKGEEVSMKKWRIWLRRTAWVAMGLVLMSGSVGISAKANAPSGNEPAMETESPGQTETEKGENTTSNGSKRFVIVECRNWKQVRLQICLIL